MFLFLYSSLLLKHDNKFFVQRYYLYLKLSIAFTETVKLHCCRSSLYFIYRFIYFQILPKGSIIACYRKLGLDLVPRQGAQMVDPDTMSVVELHQVHVASAESSQGVSVSCLYFRFIKILDALYSF